MSSKTLLQRLTYVLIDTESHVLSLRALERSLAQFPVGEVLIYSDAVEPWGRFAGAVRRIPRMASIDDYQDISIRRLAEHVATDYCIVLQWDGFVLNGQEFSSLFRHYDYIGAAWPHFREFNVGNSGFNWRSRKFLEASARLADLRDPGEPDDLFLCRRMRVDLEDRAGIRFAPEAIADHFSVEVGSVPWRTFGFHGVHRLPHVYRDDLPFLIANLSDRVLAKYRRVLEFNLRKLDAGALALLQHRIDSLGPEAAAG